MYAPTGQVHVHRLNHRAAGRARDVRVDLLNRPDQRAADATVQLGRLAVGGEPGTHGEYERAWLGKAASHQPGRGGIERGFLRADMHPSRPPQASRHHAAPVVLAAQVSATAHVAPVSSTITCGAGRPAFIFSGAITTNQAGTVTYHWALSNGTHTAARTLTFSGAGTASVVSDSFTPPADTFTGSARIVVTGPVGVTSNAAAFTLSCVHPKLVVTLMSSPPSPASFACGSPRPGFTITGAITASRATAVNISLGALGWHQHRLGDH